ncbi:conserved hypothetical protein [Ricinus communis]|uniref:Uncharacterized protein n=1 Tax=Ricinus communis TaxID=3988 RepID=B9SL23_RICCO|nr:conserved hypothetical protein [Ricinus communis]
MVAWVCFPSMPVQYYQESVLHAISSVIGSTVKVDMTTQLANRGKFARAVVELNLAKALISKFHLDGVSQNVEYEGHNHIFYSYAKRPDQETTREDKTNENDVQNRNPTLILDEESCYVPWMVTAYRPRNIQNKKNKSVIKQVNGKGNLGSRFAALNLKGDDCENILISDDEPIMGFVNFKNQDIKNRKGKNIPRNQTLKKVN